MREFLSIKRLRYDDRNQRNKQDNLKFARKEEWIMAKDIFDFIMDASKAGSAKGMKFLEELNKPGAKAEVLTQLLKGWEYDAKDLDDDVAKLLDIYKKRPTIRKFMKEISQRSY